MKSCQPPCSNQITTMGNNRRKKSAITLLASRCCDLPSRFAHAMNLFGDFTYRPTRGAGGRGRGGTTDCV
ncbi:hypothetical protein KIN20_003191 [Parelaphostrongylus tenuis]|uniref:Uncharacterized protein n=1 Tax=Parelaphostrongylus tenuis TaxID=148309 RepID=A0AAD5LWX6_PARTN|nr:hypothetical protein KIN20_003191 [Parelaphostrongylus tenuis]